MVGRHVAELARCRGSEHASDNRHSNRSGKQSCDQFVTLLAKFHTFFIPFLKGYINIG